MKQITFLLPPEALGQATEALLLGDFNNWNPEEATKLTVQADGTLRADVLLEPGKTYEYRYLLNDGRWINDWKAQGYVYKPELNVENSVITINEETTSPIETTVVTTETQSSAKKASVKAAKPKVAVKKVVKAIEPVKDDLTKITGINPKIVKLLEADGISTYKALSKTSIKKLKAVLDAAGPKFQTHNPASWPKQAKLAATADWSALQQLQNELVTGK